MRVPRLSTGGQQAAAVHTAVPPNPESGGAGQVPQDQQLCDLGPRQNHTDPWGCLYRGWKLGLFSSPSGPTSQPLKSPVPSCSIEAGEDLKLKLEGGSGHAIGSQGPSPPRTQHQPYNPASGARWEVARSGCTGLNQAQHQFRLRSCPRAHGASGASLRTRCLWAQELRQKVPCAPGGVGLRTGPKLWGQCALGERSFFQGRRVHRPVGEPSQWTGRQWGPPGSSGAYGLGLDPLRS